MVSGSPSPLFSTPASVYHRSPFVAEEPDPDELAVDHSIPSTPIDEDSPKPFTVDQERDAGPSRRSVTPVPPDVKPQIAEEVEPLRELDEADGARERDDRVCRICFGGVEEEDVMGRLISPCLCAGSMRVSSSLCTDEFGLTSSTSTVGFSDPVVVRLAE